MVSRKNDAGHLFDACVSSSVQSFAFVLVFNEFNLFVRKKIQVLYDIRWNTMKQVFMLIRKENIHPKFNRGKIV